MNSNTAIVQGALIRGLAEKAREPDRSNYARVESRIARKSFGIECYEEFDSSKHDIQRRYAL